MQCEENALQLALLFRLPGRPQKLQKTGAKFVGVSSELNLFVMTSLLAGLPAQSLRAN